MKRFILTGTPGSGKTISASFASRRLSFENAQRFEIVHERTYRLHGFELIPISPGSVLDRVAAIRGVLS